MSRSPYQALELALALLRAPTLAAQVRERPLPPDVLTLIRIAAGDQATLAKAAAASGEAPQSLVEAALLFLQQALFAPGADSYRLLGVPATASQELLKQHHRWLVHWLHPDRQTDDWQAAYMNRVNKAWQDLRTPERRHSYDNRLRRPGIAVAKPTAAALIRVPPAPPDRSGRVQQAARKLRFFPYLLGVTALGVGAALSLQYGNPRPASAVMPAPRANTGGQAAALAAAAAPPPTIVSEPAAPPAPPPENELPSTVHPVAAPARTVPGATAATPQIAALDTPGATDAASPARAAPPQAPDHPSPLKIAGHTPATSPRKKSAPASMPATPAIQPAARNSPSSAQFQRPVDTTPSALDPPQPPPALGDAAPDARLQALPVRLAEAYQRGDLAAFVRLFAPQIQTEHGGYPSTTTAYRILFASTTQRTLSLHDIHWRRPSADRAIATARFERTVQMRSQNDSQRTFGTVVLDVITRREDGPLLAGIRFEDAP